MQAHLLYPVESLDITKRFAHVGQNNIEEMRLRTKIKEQFRTGRVIIVRLLPKQTIASNDKRPDSGDLELAEVPGF